MALKKRKPKKRGRLKIYIILIVAALFIFAAINYKTAWQFFFGRKITNVQQFAQQQFPSCTLISCHNLAAMDCRKIVGNSWQGSLWYVNTNTGRKIIDCGSRCQDQQGKIIKDCAKNCPPKEWDCE